MTIHKLSAMPLKTKYGRQDGRRKWENVFLQYCLDYSLWSDNAYATEVSTIISHDPSLNKIVIHESVYD